MKTTRVRWTGYRSPLGTGIQQYIETKRALGRRFANEERTLHLVDTFLYEKGVSAIEQVTLSVVDDFLSSRPRKSARSYNYLLGAVRRLLQWLALQGVRGVLQYRGHPRRENGRRIPVLLDNVQVRQLLEAAAKLPDDPHVPRVRLRGPTYRTVFAVLYSLGLRIGEVSRLEVQDVDLSHRTLVVRNTKFGKDRIVPFGPRLATELGAFLELKFQSWGRFSPAGALFSLDGQCPVSTNSIRRVFRCLARRIGIGPSESGSPPRVHDLRHGFAVATLLRWYRDGINPAERLHHLSTFLGHVNPRATAVYLTITWELLEEAKSRFALLASTALPEVAP